MRYFKLAENMSEMSSYPRIKIGCVVVQGGKVISTGFNLNRTHPKQYALNKKHRHYEGDNTYGREAARLHAEQNALLHLDGQDLKKAEIYIYRKSKDGHGMCRPCGSCMARLRELGISRIYYTSQEGFVFEKVGETS